MYEIKSQNNDILNPIYEINSSRPLNDDFQNHKNNKVIKVILLFYCHDHSCHNFDFLSHIYDLLS